MSSFVHLIISLLFAAQTASGTICVNQKTGHSNQDMALQENLTSSEVTSLETCEDACISYNYLCNDSATIIDGTWPQQPNCEARTTSSVNGFGSIMQFTGWITAPTYTITAVVYFHDSGINTGDCGIFFNIAAGDSTACAASLSPVTNKIFMSYYDGSWSDRGFNTVVDYNTDYTVRLEISPSGNSVYVDNTLLGTWTGCERSEGTVGVGCWAMKGSFRSLRVTYPTATTDYNPEFKTCESYTYDHDHNRCYGRYHPDEVWNPQPNSMYDAGRVQFCSNTVLPTVFPSESPTKQPSTNPTKHPTNHPTAGPTMYPSNFPSTHPITAEPTTDPTSGPTFLPSTSTSAAPTKHPAGSGSLPTKSPTDGPTGHPSAPVVTEVPSQAPHVDPSISPTNHPTADPTVSPQSPSNDPTAGPTEDPTNLSTDDPTNSPVTGSPSKSPTQSPITKPPSKLPTGSPVNDDDGDGDDDADSDDQDTDTDDDSEFNSLVGMVLDNMFVIGGGVVVIILLLVCILVYKIRARKRKQQIHAITQNEQRQALGSISQTFDDPQSHFDQTDIMNAHGVAVALHQQPVDGQGQGQVQQQQPSLLQVVQLHAAESPPLQQAASRNQHGRLFGSAANDGVQMGDNDGGGGGGDSQYQYQKRDRGASNDVYVDDDDEKFFGSTKGGYCTKGGDDSDSSDDEQNVPAPPLPPSS